MANNKVIGFLVGTVATAGIALVGLGAATFAQDDGQNDAGIPSTNPGEFDDAAADAEFERLASNVSPAAEASGSSSLTGPCGGFAYSYDQDGVLIDAAMDAGDGSPPVDALGGGQAFTSGNPFLVDPRGEVVYYGFAPRTGEGPIEHSWSIDVGGVSADEGGDPNENGNNRNAGLANLDDDLPVKFSAVVQVKGRMDSRTLESCVGEGYVEFRGNGLTDPVGLAALALLGGGLLGILFNARPARTWRA